MRFFVASVTFFPYFGAVALFYLSALPGVDAVIRVENDPLIIDASLDICKYSSASDFWDRPFVVRRKSPMFQSTDTARIVDYLDGLRREIVANDSVLHE